MDVRSRFASFVAANPFKSVVVSLIVGVLGAVYGPTMTAVTADRTLRNSIALEIVKNNARSDMICPTLKFLVDNDMLELDHGWSEVFWSFQWYKFFWKASEIKCHNQPTKPQTVP
jgi:hypothetical protein